MAKPNFLNKLLTVSESATKSFLGVTNVQQEYLMPSNYRGDVPFGKSGWLFNTSGGRDIHFTFSELDDVIQAYERCAPVYSIINKQAYAYTNGRTAVTSLDGSEQKSPYAEALRKLLLRPNSLQNGKQFEAQYLIYLRLFGYCVILPIKPIGFPVSDAKQMWIIPPYMCKFNYAKESFFNLKKGYIESVTIKYGNEETTIATDDVIILRDITPGFSSPFIPGSPIKPLQQNISNLIGIYDSKGVLINYRGALGVLSPQIDPEGAIAMDPKEKMELQASLAQYGIRSNQFKFIISNSSMQWQQMGIPYRELMLTEWAEDDTMVICDGLNYPYELMANSKSTSMNGTEVNSFKAILYQDFVIPYAEMISEQLNEAFETEKHNCLITKSYSHVAVLQQDEVKKATARLLLNQALKIEWEQALLTKNQWLSLLGSDQEVPDGELLASEIKSNGAPLATIIGVGGVQSLIGVLTATGISEEARAATLNILFGISPENAAVMTQGGTTPPPASGAPAPAATN